MEPASRTARYLTLRDYLRVLRRYRIAIVLITVVGAAAGLADAKRQAPMFQATATVAFQDPAQNYALVGLGEGLVQEPSAEAQENQELLTRPATMSQVQRYLHTTTPASTLGGDVSSQISSAGFLQISANSTSASFAAQLANAVANVLVVQSNAQTRASFAAAANDVRTQIASTPKSSTNATRLSAFEAELAPLDTLSRLAQSAQLEQLAQPPGTPFSPKTVRSTVLGLVLGLALAILIAFIADALDRRLRTAQDVEETFNLPIVGFVRRQVMGKVAQLEGTSNKDYGLDVEAFRIMRRNIEFLNPDSPPRSVVVTSAVPEEGKTTVASSLAFAMAAAGKRTLLVDGDLRRPELSARLEIDRSPGLTDFLAGEATPEQVLRTITFNTGQSLNGSQVGPLQSTLVCIPAGSTTSQAAELAASTRFKEFIQQVVRAYDVVVIDSSPLLPVADTLEILPLAEGIIICSREGKTTREEAKAVKTALARFPARPTGVVITGIKPRKSEYGAYSYSYNYS